MLELPLTLKVIVYKCLSVAYLRFVRKLLELLIKKQFGEKNESKSSALFFNLL